MNTRLEKARTDISSAKSEVIIGFDQPFVIIGERINPTGRKLLTKEIEALTQHIEKVETAVEPRFQDHFLKAIAIRSLFLPFQYAVSVPQSLWSTTCGTDTAY